MNLRESFMINKTSAKNYIFVLCLSILIIRPQIIISYFPSSVFVFTILQAAIILSFFVFTRVLYINKFLLLVLIYYLYDFLNTSMQHSGSINNVIVPGIWAVSTIYIVMYCIRKIGIAESFRMLSYSFSSVLWINYILMVLYPNGLANGSHIENRYTSIHLLGQSNQMTIYIFASILLMICSIITGKKITIRYLLFTLLPVLLPYTISGVSFSATGKLGMVIIAIGLVLFWIAPKFINRISKPPIIVLISVIFFITLTRLLTLEAVSNFIVNVLGKDVTLSERTTIWSQTYVMLSDFKTLVFGIGEVGGGGYVQIWTGHIFSAHNILLQVCLLGGLCLIIIFLIMFGIAVKNIGQIADKNRALVSIMLLAFCFENMMEVYPFAMIVFSLFIFSLSGEYFINDGQIDRKESY